MAPPKDKTYPLRNRKVARAWTVAMVDILASEGPSGERDMVIRVADLVPPGQAYRRAARAPLRPGSGRRVSEEHSIRIGQSAVVRSSIRIMVRTGSLKRQVIDGKLYIELTDLGRRRLVLPEGASDGREDEGS